MVHVYIMYNISHLSDIMLNESLCTQVSCGGCHMIVLAYPRLQNGEVDSTSSNEEDENENLHKTNLNHSIKMDGTVDLGGSFGARDRRRQESIKRVNIPLVKVPRYQYIPWYHRYQDIPWYQRYQDIPWYQKPKFFTYLIWVSTIR